MDKERFDTIKEYLNQETLEWIESVRLFDRFPQISSIDNLMEDASMVKVDDLWGFIGRDGEWIAEPQFEYASNFSEGLALVQLPDDEAPHKYIDKSGSIVLDLTKVPGDPFDVFSDVVESFDFHEGLARAYDRSDRMGYIDKTGRWVINPERWTCGDFHNGVARVLKDGNESYIDHEGKIVRKPKNS